jgi:hypothetical protein
MRQLLLPIKARFIFKSFFSFYYAIDCVKDYEVDYEVDYEMDTGKKIFLKIISFIFFSLNCFSKQTQS